MLQRLLCLLAGYVPGCFLTAEAMARLRTGKRTRSTEKRALRHKPQ